MSLSGPSGESEDAIPTKRTVLRVPVSTRKKPKNVDPNIVRGQATRKTSVQSSQSVDSEESPTTQEGTDGMGASMDKEVKPSGTHPLESSSEKAEIHKLRTKVKHLEETLATTALSNDENLSKLVVELDAEKARVLMVEQDKRTLQSEKEALEKELRSLKEQSSANIEVPSVECNDKDDPTSDEDYKSIDQQPVTTTSAGAVLPPVRPNPSSTVAEQRHHQNHESEFLKSASRSRDQIRCKTATVDSKVEELQAHLIELEVAKDAAEQEQRRLAGEVTRVEEEKREEARQLQVDAAKGRRDLEGEITSLNRRCDALKAENESLQGLLDERDAANRGSFQASAMEAKLAEASMPASQPLESKQPSSLPHPRSKLSSIQRHASCDATLLVTDDTPSSDLEGSYCIISKAGLPAASQQQLDKDELTQLRMENAELQEELAAKTTTAGALQSRNDTLEKEASQNSRRIQELQANCGTLEQDCSTLKDDLRTALEESEARKQHEQILVQQLNERLTLEKSLEKLKEELTAERKVKRELEEMSTQVQIQLKAYEDDFKAERQDRESAHGKFADREKNWMDQLEALSQERDKLAADNLLLQDQIVAWKREHENVRKELETAKGKVNQKTRTLHENYQATLTEKDAEIGGLKDEIRGLKPIAEQYRVLFTQHKELQSKFEAIMVTNRHVQQVVHEMQGEKAAVDSRLRELRTVVNQVTTENEALNQQNAKLKQQIEGFERMFSGMNSKSQALEAENTELREAICLPDMQITPRSSLSPLQSLTEGRRSLPSPISQRHGQQPPARPPPLNQPQQYRNQGDYQQPGHPTDGYPPFQQQCPPHGKPYSEQGLIVKQDPPGPHDATDETDSPPLSKGDEQNASQACRNPHSRRPQAQPTAFSDPHRPMHMHRDAQQPQFPHSGPSVVSSSAHAQPDVKHRPLVAGGGHAIRYPPPAASVRYQASTQPPMDASRIAVHNSNSSTSETSLSLPLPLTNQRPDTESSDPSLPGFEANRRYIGEDINREIRHEARRYKEGNLAVEPANTDADVEEWPFDPNLTCNFCGTVFRRGQIREFRYHVDECTARSMEGRKYV